SNGQNAKPASTDEHRNGQRRRRRGGTRAAPRPGCSHPVTTPLEGDVIDRQRVADLLQHLVYKTVKRQRIRAQDGGHELRWQTVEALDDRVEYQWFIHGNARAQRIRTHELCSRTPARATRKN